ncbi:MAG: glutathione S-transferase family protein [Candidatus Binatia bacterium]
MSMSSSGGVPRVTNARLDKVKPKVVFFFAMPASIGRARVNFQARSARLQRKVSYVDLSLFQLIEGFCYAVPRAMTKQERKHRRVNALHDRVAVRPRLAAYLASERRLAFNQDGFFATIIFWMIDHDGRSSGASSRGLVSSTY